MEAFSLREIEPSFHVLFAVFSDDLMLQDPEARRLLDMRRKAQEHPFGFQYSVASEASPRACTCLGMLTSTPASTSCPKTLFVCLGRHPHLMLAAQIEKPSSFSTGCEWPPQLGS